MPETYDLTGVADAYFRARTCRGTGPHRLWLLNVELCLHFGIDHLLLQRVRVKVRAQGALITKSDPERHFMLSKKSLGKVYSSLFADTTSEDESGVQIIDF